MQENTIELPVDFDGVFRFTNFTDEDFSTLWNSKEYTFPAKSTVPLIISGESMENVQNIRKMFAKRLAQREFYKGSRYDELNGLTKQSGGVPALVDEDKEFAPFIQRCLEPLPVGKVSIKEKPKVDKPVSEHVKIVGQNESLKGNAQDIGGQLDSMQ